MHVLDEIASGRPHFAGANLSPVKKWVVHKKGIGADDEQFLGIGSSLCRALRWRKAHCSSFSSVIFSSRSSVVASCAASIRRVPAASVVLQPIFRRFAACEHSSSKLHLLTQRVVCFICSVI
ncbi:unnamed protein product [Victoria cruziana]